jgi:GTP-binding protein
MPGLVALVGRPNVGKSTLFNRLVGGRVAIVDNQPGVTRDRHYGEAYWGDVDFTVVDTGGWLLGDPDAFAPAIREQVEIALEQADVVLFLVDVNEGLHPGDEDIADVIRRYRKPHVALVVNKSDTYTREMGMGEFYALGLEDLFPIASASGSGTGELLEWVVSRLPQRPDSPEDEEKDALPKIAIVGKPNVGKSSFINAILGRNHQVVTPVAGTTRDSIFVRYTGFGLDLNLIDTAGLRRRTKVNDNLEFYSTLRTLRAIQACDVAIVVVDISTGIDAQDLNVIRAVTDQRKGLVLMANKWDLVEKDQNTEPELRAHILDRLAPLQDVPMYFTSAIERRHLLKALQGAIEVQRNLRNRIPTRELNDYLLPITTATPPPSQRGKRVKIKFVTQVEARVPTFLFYTNQPKLIKDPYKRFLEKQIRRQYDFKGAPLQLFFRES